MPQLIQETNRLKTVIHRFIIFAICPGKCIMNEEKTNKDRTQELKETLKELDKLIEKRNSLLASYEKNYMERIKNKNFSTPKINKGLEAKSFQLMNQKTQESELKILRKCLFKLHGRREEIKKEIKNSEHLKDNFESNQKAS